MDTISALDSTNNLEWLLEGGEQHLTLLIELLTLDCAPLLLDLSSQLGFQPKQSERLVVETIAESALNIHTYRAPLSARSWILSQYLKTASNTELHEKKNTGNSIGNPALKSKALALQTARLLIQAYFWPPAESAQACGIEPENLAVDASRGGNNNIPDQSNQSTHLAIPEAQLQFIAAEAEKRAVREQYRRKLADRLKEGFIILATILFASVIFWVAVRLTPEDKQTAEEAALSQSSPSMPKPTATPPGFKNIAYIIHNGDTLDKIAALTGTPVDELLRLNGITEPFMPRAGESLWVNVPDVPLNTMSASLTRDLAQLQPLTGASSLDEIRQRMLDGRNHWRTLQANYLLSTFIREPAGQDVQQDFRFQVWVSQPYYSNEVFGRVNDTQNLRHIIRDGRNYNMYIGFRGAYLDPRWDQPADVLIYSPVLRRMIFPGDSQLDLRENRGAIVSREESIANRASIVLEWHTSEGRIVQRDWVDALSGIILRCQVFNPEREFMLSDMIATSIQFDISIPNDIFDPSVS
ncbi:MAG: hypothetical protein B6D39_10970 [Anaerolineae bacterium UTCFX2]|jgi:hypothetical protein|nr:LysM peptidoglycan-binding domain-containing protein [Anaerolineales bacterium]OQY88799.1 MAG: hypothetical protein B6D39_10970 [Anaerolineae bacterium UTCFX2]